MSSFDWENEGPSVRSLEAFAAISDEKDFPETYSGQAWLAAYRIWKAVKDDPSRLESIDRFDDIPGVSLEDLGLSGFMYGWALNACKQILLGKSGPNPAILTIGEKEQPAFPAIGPAEKDMLKAIGGSKE